MDYAKHYELLINRAKGRILFDYKERHHIVPKCLNGSDDPTNLVDLTAREHYIAHQLLVKMYPNNYSLSHAAVMMTVGRSNRLYEWLRLKHSLAAKQRTGNKNGSFGRSWYHCPITLNNGKFLKNEIPVGWEKGRTAKKINKCQICGGGTGNSRRNFCDIHRPKPKSPTERGFKRSTEMNKKLSEYCKNRTKSEHPQFGKRWINDGTIQKMLPVDQTVQYLINGWSLGKVKSPLS